MAHLWTRDAEAEWIPTPLLPGDALPGIRLQLIGDSPSSWALISEDCALRLNGAPVPLGIAVLEDRDEIRAPGRHVWFSTETLARVEPHPVSTTRGFCPRCKQAIDAGTPAVRCPNCNLWHHASADLPCWTYAPTCAACVQRTELDAGFRWTPEDL